MSTPLSDDLGLDSGQLSAHIISALLETDSSSWLLERSEFDDSGGEGEGGAQSSFLKVTPRS